MQADNSESAIDNDATGDTQNASVQELREPSSTSAKDSAIPLEKLEEMQQESDTDQLKRLSSANIESRSSKEERKEPDHDLVIEESAAEFEEAPPRSEGEYGVGVLEEAPPRSEGEYGVGVLEEAPLSEEEPGVVVQEDASADELHFLGGGEFQADDRDEFAMHSLDELLSLGAQDLLGNDAMQQLADLEGKQPTLMEEQYAAPEVFTSEKLAGAKIKSKNIHTKESCRIRPAQVMYKAAAPVIQDPTIPLYLRPCGSYIPGTAVRGAHGGSNRQDAENMRRELAEYRRACKTKWEINPTCTVPMRTKGYAHKSKTRKASSDEEWRIWEERDKDRRDHDLALELGYETLVGNLLYINIPGGNDINRSWQNFLSGDLMEWGFPYKKGSLERPRMKQPEPYLAHQVKEKLWKFPRARTFQTTQEE